MTPSTDTEPAVTRGEFYTLDDLAKKLPYTRNQLAGMFRRGRLCGFVKISREILVRKTTWDAYIRRLEAASLGQDITRQK